MERPSGFFQGSELPRLLILAIVMVVGWGLVWHFAKKLPEPAEPDVTVTEKPEPIVADRSDGVRDRHRPDAASSSAITRPIPCLLEPGPRQDARRARRRRPPRPGPGPSLAESPSSIAACRSTCSARPCACFAIQSKLSTTGWLYEAWIITPETTRLPYVCVFEEAPQGLPIGPDVSERVVFNGYFLKIMKYQACDVARGAPVLVGRIGWVPHEPSSTDGENTTLRWSLIDHRRHVRHLARTLGLSAPPALHRPAVARRSFAQARRPRDRHFPPRMTGSSRWHPTTTRAPTTTMTS